MNNFVREIKASEVTDAIAGLSMEANFRLGEDVIEGLKKARETEESPLGREALDILIKNAALAEKERLPLCQDCGMVMVFLEMGQDVHIAGGDLNGAVSEGVRRAYGQGYLRKSVVSRPFSERLNTGTNAPPIIYTDIVPGDRLRIMVLVKGGGSENMSRLSMLLPHVGQKGVTDFVVKTVVEAGSNPCPPLLVGVGIGGTADKAMLLAKRALLRKLDEPNPDPEVAALEKELLEKVNSTGVGPEGFGGTVTALAVHVETFPTHIASLPVAVNLQCHSIRHKEVVL